MIKKNIYIVILLFFCSLFYNIAHAQTYKIKCIDGYHVKINLSYKLFSKELAISCLNDTLFLTDYAGTTEVQVLNNSFLEVTYETLGGTGLETKNKLILSVFKKKIIVSTLVTSYISSFSPNPDNPNLVDKESLYELKLNITGNGKNSYKLFINAHDQQKSKLHPRTNYDKNEKVILSFDPSQNIFYSTHKSINQSFTINDSKTQQSDKQQVSGTLPIISLGRNNYYYYIRGEWYRIGYHGSLFKDYFK